MKKLQKVIIYIVNILYLLVISVSNSQAEIAKEKKNGFRENHSDFFHLFFPERTDLRLGYLEEWEAKESSGLSGYDLKNAFLEGLFQAQISRDSFLTFGGMLDARRLKFSSNEFFRTSSNEEDLYKFAFVPGFGTFINDDFLFWTQAEVGSYSDLDSGPLDKDNFQAWGNAQLVYRLNPSAQLLIGVSYSNDYLETNLLPFFGIRLMSDTGAFHLAADLPFNARVGYYITPYIETFAQMIVKGDKYRMRLNGEKFNVGVHDERAGIGLRFWLGSNVSWTFEGGRTISSELKYYSTQPGQFINGEIDSHWFAQSYLGVAF